MNDDTKTKKPRFWIRAHNWILHHRAMSLIIGGVILIIIASVTAFIILAQRPAETPSVHIKPVAKPKPIVYYSPLTGKVVSDAASTKQAVTGIMIENSPDARPQSGVKDAGIVYEAVAEGGITRFLALYQQEKPQLIGPVRSVRMYYVDWVAAYNASVAHIGGSAAALKEVRNGSYRDIDQFFNAGSYWRANDRYAPHNVYTSFEKLDALNKAKGYTESNFTGFTRVDGKASAKPDATKVTINISGPAFNTSYTYDPATNKYARFLAGVPHTDREQGQITPDVVVAMKVDTSLVMEDGYRESITTIGNGEAIIFQNGTAQTVTWHKPAKTSPITFTDAAGKDVPLVRGQTWITAVPSTGSVAWQ
jgi:DUF3048 family protein